MSKNITGHGIKLCGVKHCKSGCESNPQSKLFNPNLITREAFKEFFNKENTPKVIGGLSYSDYFEHLLKEEPYRLARYNNLPDSVYAELLKVPCRYVRNNLLINPSTPEDIIDKLATERGNLVEKSNLIQQLGKGVIKPFDDWRTDTEFNIDGDTLTQQLAYTTTEGYFNEAEMEYLTKQQIAKYQGQIDRMNEILKENNINAICKFKSWQDTGRFYFEAVIKLPLELLE